MDAPPEPDDALLLNSTPYDQTGWPRGFRVDASTTRQSGVSRTTNQSLGFNGFIDTPDYGILSATANLVRTDESGLGNQPFGANPSFNPSAKGSSWRIDQRALPLNGGWRANHSLGDINTGNAPLARGIGRVTLPSAPIRGLGGQWTLGDTVDLNASEGRAGVFNGIDLSGFNQTGGRIVTGGAQSRVMPDWASGGRLDAAVQLIDAQDLPIDALTGARQSARGLFTSAAWEGTAPWADELAPGTLPPAERQGGLRLQGNLVRSTASSDGGATGLWLDAAFRTDRWRQTAGLFRFDPNLRWGGALLASNLQGLYWQGDTATRQWQWGGNAELSDAVSQSGLNAGNGSGRSAYASGFGLYRIDSKNSVNATASVRALGSPAQSLALTWDRSTGWGQTQWRSDVVHAVGQNTLRLGVDQSWQGGWLPPASSLSTSLAWERVNGSAVGASTGWTWGVLGSLSPLANLSLDASLRGANRSDGSSSLNANLAASLNLQRGWSLSLRYTESRGQEPLSNLLTSALSTALTNAVNANNPAAPASRSVQLLLSYQGRAGSTTRPLGGVPGGGAGSISGMVYFDADNNGRREALEAGVPGITVTLDKRYTTRTDAQGRYEFAYVAAGDHTLEMSADNVPLPWNPVVREGVKTTVLVRGASTQDFPVQRER